jgi:hypothetical protein
VLRVPVARWKKGRKRPSDEERRRRFACPPARGYFDGVDLSFLDPADRDDRHFLILAEHPDLHRAIEEGAEQVVVGGRPINPRLHLSLHEVVAAQLWDDDPPEVWETAKRLQRLGYERHDILHMLGSVVTHEIWWALKEEKPYDHDRYVRALDALPESWQELGRAT